MPLPEPSADSTTLVTGASSGIGAAFAHVVAKRGYGVTLVARREDRLRTLAEELAGEHDVRCEVIGADLEAASARDDLEKELRDRELDVEILVNNAGFGWSGRFARADRERQVEMVRVNCEAVVDLTARFLPAMVEREQGAVINVASTAAFQPMPLSATYGASKAFVLSFGDALHEELRGTGVTVTSLCPGPVRTEFTEHANLAEAEERTPGAIWMTAEQVAESAVRATERGRRIVVPGAMNQAGALLGQHSPRVIQLPLVRRLWRRAQR